MHGWIERIRSAEDPVPSFWVKVNGVGVVAMLGDAAVDRGLATRLKDVLSVPLAACLSSWYRLEIG